MTKLRFLALFLAASLALTSSLLAEKIDLPTNVSGSFTYTSQITQANGLIVGWGSGNMSVTTIRNGGLRISIFPNNGKTVLTFFANHHFEVKRYKKGKVFSIQRGTWNHGLSPLPGRLFTSARERGSSHVYKSDFGLSESLLVFILKTEPGRKQKFVARKEL